MNLIQPNWPAPANVYAFSTTRNGGESKAPFDSLNLALHVKDQDALVESNRALLQSYTAHPANPHWLTQTHSTDLVAYNTSTIGANADGVYSQDKEQACVVMTADCLPVLFCSKQGDFAAAVHAGWRGLADGILLKTLNYYSKPSDLMAWIGPAISQKYFEVGEEVKTQFIAKDPYAEKFFIEHSQNKFMADLAAIAEHQLKAYDVVVYQSGLCTYADSEQFFSYRRDGNTGRMASMIWIGD